MQLLRTVLTILTRLIGGTPDPVAALAGSPAPTAQPSRLRVEKDAVALVGGGRRPKRLRRKVVSLTCTWVVTEHHPTGAAVLTRIGDVPPDVDVVLTTTVAGIKKVGAGRRPSDLRGVTVRVVDSWHVREDLGDRVVLVPVAA